MKAKRVIRKSKVSRVISTSIILIIILLVIINLNTLDFGWWYIKIALPIVFVIYLIINILLSVRFIKTNRFVKTGIILLGLRVENSTLK